MNGGYWQMDRDYHTTNIPTQFKLEDWWSADADKQIILHQTAYQNVVCENNTKINPHSIRRFTTLKEAEDFLLGGEIISSYGIDFYTIRKIYF
jgi:hypothetical protein